MAVDPSSSKKRKVRNPVINVNDWIVNRMVSTAHGRTSILLIFALLLMIGMALAVIFYGMFWAHVQSTPLPTEPAPQEWRDAFFNPPTATPAPGGTSE